MNKPIRVGTDCSGIEAPIEALKQLSIPFEHKFSCEIDKYARESIKANYSPEILFTDMTTRKLKDIPDIDLYVCGFPCQPFSLAGHRNGTDDPRGTIFWHCLSVIKKKTPKIFILENVKGLLSINGGETFKEIISALEDIKKYNKKIYDIKWKVLNTRDYGIPQNRERVFIVGIHKSLGRVFEWPEKKPMKDIREFVDWNQICKPFILPYLQKSNLLNKIPKDSIFIDITFTQNSFKMSNCYTPCLTTGRGLYCVPLQRKATIRELLSLQGFSKSFKQVVSDNQIKKQIGNSMSVNVIKNIISKFY